MKLLQQGGFLQLLPFFVGTTGGNSSVVVLMVDLASTIAIAS